MAIFSNYLENKLVDFLFRSGTFSKPSTLAIALCTAAPTDADTGALAGKEVANTNGYTRIEVSPDDLNWSATQGGTAVNSTGTGGTTSNIADINFPTATGGAWGTITHIAIVDDDTYGAGHLFFWGALVTPRTINDGDDFSFLAGEIQVQLDN